MFTKINYEGSVLDQYNTLSKQLAALLDGETNKIANLSNASALLNQFLDNINWVGFYLMQNGELVLGPFQGLPACVRIPMGRGVCGTAVSKNETIVVEDVHAFPGHIACDSASNSEIVIPLTKDGEVIGVLDIDSPIKGRFSSEDQKGLELFVETLIKYI
ncbi:GAF domain-containing protein [Lysinibacillus telephonicus]|uniref:GAF domain-containing protein n=1 Tax=Lysinibacillus telephonicus TaxID=1714840 RepID=A0A3S0JRB1_9BACI|nr:GAF domain-containing protein [Lysinibacillus telephonicus]RTQ92524.1 GAF domain-containing protein [Lysinibacillus telephonicus]